jgi:ribosome biogenesis protein ERB1
MKDKSSKKSKNLVLEAAELSKESDKLLNKKTLNETTNESDDDSSDEELVVRTGNVPRKWYKQYDHAGYDINSKRVIKPKEEDEIEKFLKKAEDKNWWRNIYDEMNNKTIFISDEDLALIQRIRKNLFANKNVDNDDYFEKDIPYQLHPLSNHMPPKRAFEMSKHEKKAINRLVYLIKNGFLNLDQQKEKEEEKIYDIWQYENTDPNSYHPGKGYQPPKRELPDHDLSYNPPEELVGDETGIKHYSALRKIPQFEKTMEENFDRCCDLFMSSRFVKKKLDLKEEDVLPNLPKPEELKPFPTKENITLRGHESSIRAMTMDPQGKFLISGDNAGFVFFWDIQTAKIVKKLDINDRILKISYNSILNLLTICGKEAIYFTVPYYLEKKAKNDIMELVRNKIHPIINEKFSSSAEENKEYIWKIPKSGSAKEKSGILFYLKWKDGVLDNVTWHSKGDYFATLTKNSLGKSQVYVHSLSRLIHQTPFSKIKGTINAVSFHPIKPYFLVATNSNIFIYNLQKQVIYYFILGNGKKICK